MDMDSIIIYLRYNTKNEKSNSDLNRICFIN